MAVAVAEIKLGRRHPADYRWLGCFLAGKILRLNVCGIESFAGREQFCHGNGEGDMTFMKLAAVRRGRSPQPQHRSSIGAGPQENDIAREIAMSKLQSDDLNIKFPRCFRIGNWQMRFV